MWAILRYNHYRGRKKIERERSDSQVFKQAAVVLPIDATIITLLCRNTVSD
jgi:hypothetical protein